MTEVRIITVTGVVQRVGFRRYAERLAIRLKITGYVENRNDNSVRLFIQGESPAVESFEEAIRKAPEPIVVESLESKKAKFIPRVKYFQLKSASLAAELQEGFGAMETAFNDYRSEFSRYSKLTEENFKSLEDKYEEIAEKMKVLETLEEESTESRRELTRAIDRLSSLIEQDINSRKR